LQSAILTEAKRRKYQEIAYYAARELAFRLFCRHRQGLKPNLLVYCTRRGGSTWLMNTLAAHPGMRYVNRPFLTAHLTRHRHRIPDLARAAGHTGDHTFRHVVHFEGEDEQRFREFANEVLRGEREIYPTLNFRAPYFHRRTDRIAFQMTSGGVLIEWFDANFPVETIILLRHPITNALSIVQKGWLPECGDFLNHQWFVETHLTGAQVDLARRVLANGSLLSIHVLDWSLKMLVPVRAHASGMHPRWTLMTYEQLVLEPERLLRLIAERHDFAEFEPMLAQVRRPSRTVTSSTAAKVDDPAFLLDRWRGKVPAEEERDLLDIPAAFGLEMYRPGHRLADEPYIV
jgi:hypothetical protein